MLLITFSSTLVPFSQLPAILDFLTDHIATRQLDTVKKEVTGDMLPSIYHTLKSIFPIFLIIFLNSDIDLLNLTKLGNLFQIKFPRKSTELVP